MNRLEDSDQVMIDSIPTMAWRCRPDGFVEFVNRRWLEYTGLATDQARGWGWTAAIHPDDLEGLTNRWREILASEQPGEIEARMRRCGGEYRWFLIRVEPARNGLHDIVKWYGISTDIEDRRRAESLRAAEKRTLEMIADGASLKDVLNHLCSSIDAQVSPSVTTILLIDPDGKRLWQTAGPLAPRGWISVISPVPVRWKQVYAVLPRF
jgi:PAS domain S-box-containing protein